MSQTDYNAAARVARGAVLLDERRPGWADQIAMSDIPLNMEDCATCVLGHLFGDYIEGDHKLFPNDVNGVVSHGFVASVNEDEYDSLRTCWLSEIAKRRGT
jgi:hypothetical protein